MDSGLKAALCSCLLMICLGCAASNTYIRPGSSEPALLRDVDTLRISFSHDGWSDHGWCNFLILQLQDITSEKFAKKRITVTETGDDSSRLLLATNVWIHKMPQPSRYEHARKIPTFNMGLVIELRDRFEGIENIVFRHRIETRSKSYSTISGDEIGIGRGVDQLARYYSIRMDELLGYFSRSDSTNTIRQHFGHRVE
jgi:hypothetical protein